MFLKKESAPFLYKSFNTKDLYFKIALDLKSRCKALHVFSDKLLRKIIKIKCLAMLNNGGLTTESHIARLVDELYEKDSEDYKKIIKVLIANLADLPIVIEFRGHGDFIAEESRVFILTNNDAITLSNYKHILSSPGICGVESLAMTFLMGYISVCHHDILLGSFGPKSGGPLTTIHNGMALLSYKKLSSEDLNVFNEGFSVFVTARLGILLPIETIEVGFDFKNKV